MPGVSCLVLLDPAAAPSDSVWERAVASTACAAPSSAMTRYRDARFRLATSVHESYPVLVHEDDHALICFEGRAYGIEGGAVLTRLAASMPAPDDPAPDPAEALRRMTRDWDGDFIAIGFHKATGAIGLVTDAGGRLPLYTHVAGDRVIVSRDQRFLLELMDRREIDRVGLSQLLLFGFMVGRNTLIQGVERVRPGFSLAVDQRGTRIDDAPWRGIELESKPRASLPLARNAADLAEQLVLATRARAAADGHAVLGLSAGLDSRAVGAALARDRVSFEALTFVDAAGLYAHETEPAHALADTLGAPWKLLRIGPASGRRLRRMLEIKLGANTLAMSFGLEFFDQLLTTGYRRKESVHSWSPDSLS